MDLYCLRNISVNDIAIVEDNLVWFVSFGLCQKLPVLGTNHSSKLDHTRSSTFLLIFYIYMVQNPIHSRFFSLSIIYTSLNSTYCRCTTTMTNLWHMILSFQFCFYKHVWKKKLVVFGPKFRAPFYFGLCFSSPM